MGHVTDGADVDGGLAGDHLGGQRGQLGHVQHGEVLEKKSRE